MNNSGESKGRIVGIDYGLKRIGLAISDENCLIASSLGVVESCKNSQETIQRILKVLQPYEVKKIVVGYPIHMNGNVGFLADEVQYFVSLLQSYVSCSIILLDERLSSAQAERALKEGGVSRKKRSQTIDSVSAIIILQSHLGF
jgi:putative pre-16S rRNA nuclease